MKKTFAALLVLLSFSCPHAAVAQDGMKVIVFGDSLTSGYQLQENDAYPSKLYYKLREIGYENVDVINMSEAGRTTGMALSLVDNVSAQRPDIVIVQLGSSDTNRGVSPDVIYNNLVDIIGKLQQRGIYTILFGIESPEGNGPTYVRQLRAGFERIANFYRIPLYPDTLLGIRGNQELTLADGFHPNGKGIDIMLDNSYLIVDAGLRWKWDRINEQRGFQPEIKEALPPAMPPTAEPKALPPVSGR
ncbi:MAG: GDSL-type esterase/lipase family protein [Rickettsiales bacterium]|jgi:acyl-CoA thioesterase-1|nr:GDSL-type esterase/lipase family protein [Rickettsiales bacterium]